MADLITKLGSEFKKGDILFKEGEDGNAMYVIHSGSVKISIRAKNAEQVLTTLSEGEFLGEMALFTDQKRSATATVIENSTILKIEKSSMDFMMKSNKSFATNLIKKLCERLYKADMQIEEILVLSKEARILKGIISYWKENGVKDNTGKNLLIPYEGFLEYIDSHLGIEKKDTKKILLSFKHQNLAHVRKDMKGNYYLNFSSNIFQYLKVSE